MVSPNFPPGPPPANNPITQFRLLNDIQRDMLAVFGEWHRRYGDAYVLRFGPLSQVMLHHPDDLREVLVTQAGKFIKDADYRDESRGLARFLGRGLLTSNGEFWKRQRKLAAPAFHARRIEAYADTMVSHTEQMLAGWRDGAQRDVAREMTRLTLLIVAKTLFDADVAADVERVGRAMDAIQHYFGHRSLWPAWIPTPRELRARQARRDLDEIVYRFIRERRASGEDRGDLLSMFLLAEDEDRQRMTDEQARDEIVTLLLAGHETTANTLNWTWTLLAQHPEAEAELHAELDSVLGGRAPTLADLPALTYTEQVIKESMRLYPPAWSYSREAAEDVPLRTTVIPKGSVVGLMIYFTQRDARWFPEPEQFRPERFTPEREQQLSRYAYLPFGAGPRVCIGNSFALMEARLLLATIAQRYRLRLAPGQRVTPEALITLNPKGGLRMTLQQRAPLAAPEAAHALAD